MYETRRALFFFVPPVNWVLFSTLLLLAGKSFTSRNDVPVYLYTG